jgi:Flp pilus assembly pilin Flp
MTQLRKLRTEQGGQDIAEYAVMLAVILVLVVGTIRLVGSNANNVFSAAGTIAARLWDRSFCRAACDKKVVQYQIVVARLLGSRSGDSRRWILRMVAT